jgi:hypothetical protein
MSYAQKRFELRIQRREWDSNLEAVVRGLYNDMI